MLKENRLMGLMGKLQTSRPNIRLCMHTPHKRHALTLLSCGQHRMSQSVFAHVHTMLYLLGCTIRQRRLHDLDFWVGLFDAVSTFGMVSLFHTDFSLNKGHCKHAPAIITLGIPLSYSSEGCSLLSNTEALLNHWLLCSFADK